MIRNQVTDNELGITFSGSENFFRNNRMENNGINFADTSGKNDVDSSNTINGKPIYYIINQQNITVPADASMVYLEGCSNIIIQNLKIKHTYQAIALFNSSNCKIYGNTLEENEIGIILSKSINNSIIGNELLKNSDYSIKNYDSDNNTIANNLIKANGGGINNAGNSASSRNTVISSNQIIENNGCGIQAGIGTTITGNYIKENGQHAIYFWDASNSIIHKNTIKQNGNCGISFTHAANASITGNDLSKNNIGIEMGTVLGQLSECSITENNFAQNSNHAIIVYCDIRDSRFYLNNFIDNNNGSVQVSIKGRFVWKGDKDYNVSSNVFPQYAPSYNAWDNGSMGNFWSDHNSNVEGATYEIAYRNIDRHPLRTPIEFKALEMPSIGTPQEFSSFPTILVLAVFLPVIAIVATILIHKRLKKRQLQP